VGLVGQRHQHDPAQGVGGRRRLGRCPVPADAASSLPLHVYRKTAQGREQVTSGRLVELLARPGPSTSQADLVSTLISHLAIYGNPYIGKFRDAGEVVQLGLLHPERIPGAL
jgi:phage portal protein BeeE